MFKLKSIGNSGKFNRELSQRPNSFFLNGRMLNWEPILEGVSSYQRFDFRPDFFLIYVNDLPNGLKIFAK